jgi:formate/nitrite transporter FocA (FNT family)
MPLCLGAWVSVRARRIIRWENWAPAELADGDLSNLTVGDFLLNNLLPVTIGNIIGGAVLVGAVYWFVYLRAPANSTP